MSDGDRIRGLAGICLKRTLGCPYFLIEFRTMLEEEELLTFNLGLLKWVWDEDVIEEETMSTDIVVDLLQARMKKLPDDVQLLLQYAACHMG
jgi:predicted ATPase